MSRRAAAPRPALLLGALAASCLAGAARAQAPSPPATAPSPAATPAAPGATPAPAPDLAPRERYNAALAALQEGDLEGAATGFLEARDAAGTDSELRFRSAFNLGIALGRQADGLGDKPEEAIEVLRQSAAWFRDAVRLRPGGEDGRVNLEIVLRRVQILADRLNQDAGRLEARLNRVIDDQRGVRDRIRGLIDKLEGPEGTAHQEPTVFTEDFESIAALERSLLAEVGAVSDLAGDELTGLESRPDQELTERDRVRRVQLRNLDHFLQQGRQSLSDARRLLNRLEALRAHRRADAALAELKRARDQLADPVRVLRSVAEEEALLLAHTEALNRLRKGTLSLAPGTPASPPAWLSNEHMSDRQLQAEARTSEVLERFEAANRAPAGGEAPREPDPGRERVLAAAREALPHLGDAVSAMRNAAASLGTGDLEPARDEEQEALAALGRAIERFAGLRDLIEIAHGEQIHLVHLLAPPGEKAAHPPEMTAAERSRALREATGRNRERMTRLEDLIDEERDAKLAELEDQGGGPDAGAGADRDEEATAIRQRFELARLLRGRADEALGQLEAALGRLPGGGADEARRAAGQALEEIEELRRLFFSIVEHLKELYREQAETHDQTASTDLLKTPEERAAKLGPLADRQQGQAGTAELLAGALESQAQAASGAGAGAQPGGQGPSPQALAGAAGQVKGAHGEMRDAASLLAEAREPQHLMSYDRDPIVEHQRKAMEHLESALRLLEPPRHKQQQDQPQDEQEQQQAQAMPKPSQDEDQGLSRRQAERRLEAVAEREAERQRARRDRRQSQPEPVEKDW